MDRSSSRVFIFTLKYAIMKALLFCWPSVAPIAKFVQKLFAFLALHDMVVLGHKLPKKTHWKHIDVTGSLCFVFGLCFFWSKFFGHP